MREKRWNAAVWSTILSSICSGFYFHYSPIRKLMSMKEEVGNGVDGRTVLRMDGTMREWKVKRMQRIVHN